MGWRRALDRQAARQTLSHCSSKGTTWSAARHEAGVPILRDKMSRMCLMRWGAADVRCGGDSAVPTIVAFRLRHAPAATSLCHAPLKVSRDTERQCEVANDEPGHVSFRCSIKALTPAQPVGNHINSLEEASWRVCMRQADGPGQAASIGPYRTQYEKGIGIAHILTEIAYSDLVPNGSPKIARNVTRLLTGQRRLRSC